MGRLVADDGFKLSKKASMCAPNLFLAGQVIYNLAIAQAYLKFDADVSSVDREKRLPLLETLSEEPYLVQSVKTIFNDAIKHLNQ